MKTKLTRSATNKVIAGVCGGIAESFGWDVTLVRLGFIALAFAHGVALPLYLVLLFVMPKTGQVAVQPAAATGGSAEYHLAGADRNHTLGLVLLGFGTLIIASMLHITGPVIALALVGAGYYLLRKR